MKRREALKTIGITTISAAGITNLVSCAPSAQEGSRNVAAQGVLIGKIADFLGVGSSVAFDFGGSPAIAVRTSDLQTSGIAASGTNFVALSRICTHLGCTLNLPEGTGKMGCNCHGSVFALQTGAVLTGPAGRPLDAIKLEVRGTELYAVGG